MIYSVYDTYISTVFKIDIYLQCLRYSHISTVFKIHIYLVFKISHISSV